MMALTETVLDKFCGVEQDSLEDKPVCSSPGCSPLRLVYEWIEGELELVVGLGILSSMLAKKDPYTDYHQAEVARLVAKIVRTDQFIESFGEVDEKAFWLAGRVHDAGKLSYTIPAEILQTPERLTSLQREIIKMHPDLGEANIGLLGLRKLSPKAKHMMRIVLKGVKQHQELFNGQGYPEKLKGEEISLVGRTVAVADSSHAALYHRYNKGKKMEGVLWEMVSEDDTRYDRRIVAACKSVFDNGFRFNIFLDSGQCVGGN